MLIIRKYFISLYDVINGKALSLFSIIIVFAIIVIIGDTTSIAFYTFITLILSLILQTFLLIKKSYVFYLVRVVLCVFICSEFIFGEFSFNNSKIEELKKTREIRDNYYEDSPLLGKRLKPNIQSAKNILMFGEDTIRSVNYSSDKFSRRVDENFFCDTDDSSKKYYALFLGCSFTFGQGLPYKSSFPFLFEKNNPDYRSYNYGFIGYGPHQIALLFERGVNTINKTSTMEPTGFALYTFINDHLNRVYGGSNYLSYGSKTPDVYINNDSLIIKKRNKYQLYLANFLFNSKTLRYFNIHFTYPKNEDYYKRFANIINYIAKQYSKQFPNQKFYVGIYPGQKDLVWTKHLNHEISLIIVPTPPDFKEHYKDYFLAHDSHPNEKLNSYYIDYITNSIGKCMIIKK